MEDEKFHFQVADYVVFALTLVVSVGIGIYYAFSGGRQKTTSEYLLGGRNMPFLPVGLSLFVSYQSSIMMLGYPAEAYMYGLQIAIGLIPVTFTSVLSAYVVVPLIHPLKITSGFEYLGLRFNSRTVRLLGSVMGILFDMWYMGIVLFGPAVALQAVTDFPLWMSIFGLALMSVIYTTIGGLKAVIWTDVFQSFVMFSGILAVLIKGTIAAGGAKAVWDIGQRGGRMDFFNFNPDPRARHTFWNVSLSFAYMGLYLACKQSTIQRVSSISTAKDAKRVVLFVAPSTFLIYVLSLYEGVVCYAYYVTKECDPFASGQLDNPNQITPHIVMDIFHTLTGMPGLFVASLFSASLSTLSSSLSSLSALLWTDFIHPVMGDTVEWKATLIAKLIVAVCGTIGCGLAGLISLVGGTLHQISTTLMTCFGGPLMALFLLGAFCPRVTAKGVTIGGVLGLLFTLWIAMGMSFTPGLKKTPYLPPAPTTKCYLPETAFNDTDNTSLFRNGSIYSMVSANHTMDEDLNSGDTVEGIEHLYTISYTYIGIIGCCSTMFIAYISSIITGTNKPGDVDPRYLLPVSDSLLVFLPKSIRQYISSKGTQFINISDSDKLKFSTTEKSEIESLPFIIEKGV